MMASMLSVFVWSLLFIFSVSPACSTAAHGLRPPNNQTFRSGYEARKMRMSPDGDTIDCVLTHKQPAFDHPLLKGQKPLDPPELPKGHNYSDQEFEDFQVWKLSGESCPEGTIPIRRTSEQDMLRASSMRRFGRKRAIRPPIRRDTSTYHEVSPEIYGDSRPRFFTYWTSDAYHTTGCYNLLCSGFVQTNRRIAIGAAISPTSSYNGRQFDISILIWKDPKHGHWWLQFGSRVLVGYWPSFLFTHLRGAGSMVQYGGEVVNKRPSGFHTSTQMGSGHFAGEGFGKASYFRNLQVVDWDNSLIPLSNLKLTADHSNCYDIRGGINRAWGNYFFYGGPGRNSRCP
nr:Glycine--tRNA ligase beta subunit like [Ipomoea batatas]